MQRGDFLTGAGDFVLEQAQAPGLTGLPGRSLGEPDAGLIGFGTRLVERAAQLVKPALEQEGPVRADYALSQGKRTMCHYSKKRQFAKPVRSGQVPGPTSQVGIRPASLYWRCTARAPARAAAQDPRVQNAGKGFFEDGDFAAVLLEVPAHEQAVIKFLRLAGWRVEEPLGLTWDQVDREGEVIRLYADETKGKAGRVFPYGLFPDVKALLDTQWQNRNGAFVFHDGGQRVAYTTLHKHWKAACKRVEVAGRLIHDLRRPAARAMRRAGLSEGEIMKLCEWKTRAMFDRYNIIDEADLASAVAKLSSANGTVGAQSTLSPEQAGR